MSQNREEACLHYYSFIQFELPHTRAPLFSQDGPQSRKIHARRGFVAA